MAAIEDCPDCGQPVYRAINAAVRRGSGCSDVLIDVTPTRDGEFELHGARTLHKPIAEPIGGRLPIGLLYRRHERSCLDVRMWMWLSLGVLVAA